MVCADFLGNSLAGIFSIHDLFALGKRQDVFMPGYPTQKVERSQHKRFA
jgi:hypothetical protein